jgi:hypothetical protein
MTDYPSQPFTRTRARLQRTLTELLDDGTGRVHPALQPLADMLLAMPKPDRALNWLHNNPRLPGYLQALARGEVPLTHDGLHSLDSWRTAAHLRDLLMACGALPTVDRQIPLFEAWTRQRLAALADLGHARLLRQFTTWHQLPALHAAARRAPLTPGSRNYAAEAFTQAEDLLGWLDLHELRLIDLSQGNLDRWDVERRDRAAQVFLRWAQSSGHAPRRLQQAPTPARRQRPPISQQRRLSWTRRALTDDSIDLRTRVAAGLLLLFAQPITRIVRLTVDDVLHHGQEDGQGVYLRLGDPPAPVPEPLAGLLLELVQARANMSTASNRDSRWLFPGGRAGQPLTPGALRQRFQALGLPTIPARTAAFSQLVLQAPAPVVAAALGYQSATAEQHRAAAGGTWSRYAASRRDDKQADSHPATAP